jgi:predicted HTH transcriptional regulator
MDLPPDLDQWDYSTIFDLATGDEYEPERYDFKEMLNVTKGSADYAGTHAKNISKTVCSMANGNGGYIIFGVKDPKKYPALSAEQRIVGIPRSSEILKEFGDKITDIQPNVHCNPRRQHERDICRSGANQPTKTAHG